jgi:hypothetical protein
MISGQEVSTMNSGKSTIYIRQVPEKPGFYVAYFTSEVLQATFSLHFRDTITGAIALNNFVEMLRIKNKFHTCNLQIDESLICTNPAVRDLIEIYNNISTYKKKEGAFSPGV